MGIEPTDDEIAAFYQSQSQNRVWVEAAAHFGMSKHALRNRWRRYTAAGRGLDPRLTEPSRFYKGRLEGRVLAVKQLGAIAVIADQHAPSMSEEILDWAVDVAAHYNCLQFINLGDVVDEYAASRWPKLYDALDAEQEFQLARKQLELLNDAFPHQWITLGNHDLRNMYNGFMTNGEAAYVPFDKTLNAPLGWSFCHEIELTLVTGEPVHVRHDPGFSGATPALAAAKSLGISTISGHHHTAQGVWQYQFKDYSVTGMNVGCMIDATSYMFDYTGKKKPLALGMGVIDGNGVMISVPYRKVKRFGGYNGH